MSDADCVSFLQWALPRLRMRWAGFRRVRRQVCRRIERRRQELGLPDLEAYRAYLERTPDEWPILDGLCRVTISRFYRDRRLFATLGAEVLPAVAAGARTRGERTLAVWSAGCASGEEPYTLALMWDLELARRFPELRLRVVATDTDPALLRRAREACYGAGSLRELPYHWLSQAFVRRGRLHCLRPAHKQAVELRRHDVRHGAPDGRFHLVLCRNLVFTYFDLELQRELAGWLAACLCAGGALVVGAHERIPDGVGLEPWPEAPSVYRKPS